jgi:hypothetical protein
LNDGAARRTFRLSSRYPEPSMTMPATEGSRSDSLDLPRSLPIIRLHHGEALWVLAQLGFQGKVRKDTFYEYIKSLRKLGTPFEQGKIGYGRKAKANYTYYHMMELGLVLTLRVYHVVPDSVLMEIVRCRRALYRCYRRAYTERLTGLGAAVTVSRPGGYPLRLRGVFLDLQIDFLGGKLAHFGPPRLLGPFESLRAFAERDVAARALLPINLSLLAERMVGAAVRAPTANIGPRHTGRNATTREAAGENTARSH